MKTSPECIPCLKRQIAYCAQLASPSETEQSKLRQHAENLLCNFDFSLSPPVNAMQIYSTISQLSNNPDPFKALKEKSTAHTLAMRAAVQEKIRVSDDPMYTAAVFALAGNIIDYGSQQEIDLEEALNHSLSKPPVIDHFDDFRKELGTGKSLLFLGDNCGEIIFDGLLIDQLPCQTRLALKESPIINDATVSDGYHSRLNRSCEILSNGTACPGTPLNLCSSDFRALFAKADIIVSKGQGNFETLSEVERTIYFFLTVKCKVVAQHVKKIANSNRDIRVGDSVIVKKEPTPQKQAL